MTKRETLNAIINGTIAQADLIEFATHELEKLDKRGPSKADVEKKAKNNELAVGLLADMVKGTEYTVADLATNCATVAGLSGSKITYLINSLVKTGEVVARYEKRKTFYSVA